jgi:predicted  nucleic acid-binding Zn-ribbon protein
VKSSPIVAVVFLAGLLLSSRAQAQTGGPPGPGTLDAVVQELRLLRQAIDKQGATTARVQLLIGRLGLQDQRTARAQQALEKLHEESRSLARERDDAKNRERAIAERLDEATREDERRELERERPIARARVADLQTQLATIEARLGQAKQALDAETGRYDELDGWLKDLDRQLARQGS